MQLFKPHRVFNALKQTGVFSAQPRRQIYSKGTELDKKDYSQKQSESDLLIQYYENHMADIQLQQRT